MFNKLLLSTIRYKNNSISIILVLLVLLLISQLLFSISDLEYLKDYFYLLIISQLEIFLGGDHSHRKDKRFLSTGEGNPKTQGH